MSPMSDILIRKSGRAGRITLNRPKALNAVTWEMVRAIDAALEIWRADDDVALVMIDAAGERAFAAGGDIVDLYDASRAGDLDFGRRFWAEEYRLNLKMARYQKPIVSLMHGYTMGGGVGISCHASHRVVDETVQIALPECGIGLIPDVGSSWLLAQMPAGLGAFVGLTGYRMGAEDAIQAGFADQFVPRKTWEALVARLSETGDPDVIAAFAQRPPVGALAGHGAVADMFAHPDIAAVVRGLEQAKSDASSKALSALDKPAPLSVVCAHHAIAAAAHMTLEQAFALEFRYVWRAVEHSDFLEGIRAQVIDKDRSPQWRHASLADVSEAEVNAMFADLGPNEWTP